MFRDSSVSFYDPGDTAADSVGVDEGPCISVWHASFLSQLAPVRKSAQCRGQRVPGISYLEVQ